MSIGPDPELGAAPIDRLNKRSGRFRREMVEQLTQTLVHLTPWI